MVDLYYSDGDDAVIVTAWLDQPGNRAHGAARMMAAYRYNRAAAKDGSSTAPSPRLLRPFNENGLTPM
jgi:hypothetical protein